MAIRKFLTSVADVYAYDNSEQLLFTAKTLLDSSIDVALGSTPVRGGRGSQLEYIYYHTAEMKFTLTDTQWNLALLGYTSGSTPQSGAGNQVYREEHVPATMSGPRIMTATVTKATPIEWLGQTKVYGWLTTPYGSTIVGTFSGKNFTSTGALPAADTFVTGGDVCIRYYSVDADSTSITISANMIPAVLKLVMETQLNSADVTTNKIGIVQIIAPTVTLSGAFNIAMKSDGVSNTPLTASALAYNGAPGTDACAATPYYAQIFEIIDSAHWYDNVIGLSVAGGDFDLDAGLTTQLDIWAVPVSGAAFRAPVADLAFTSGATGTIATVGLHTGIVTAGSGTGVSALINVLVSNTTGYVNPIDTSVTVSIV